MYLSTLRNAFDRAIQTFLMFSLTENGLNRKLDMVQMYMHMLHTLLFCLFYFITTIIYKKDKENVFWIKTVCRDTEKNISCNSIISQL